MGTTFIEDELLKRSSSGILTPMRDGDVIQSSQLAMTTSSDPALNAAVTTAIIDEFGGVIISLTGAGNSQTLETPTSSTAGKVFTVVSDDGNEANSIQVNGITLTAGEAQKFIWDGSAWGAVTAIDADDIALTPTGDIVATDVQAGIAELDTEKMKRITSVDDEITRFDSTGGDVQGYSSNAPTISDVGNIQAAGGIDSTPIGGTSPANGVFEILKGKIDELIQASTDALTTDEMAGTVINNYGQGAANTQTLPSAVEGLNALFIIATVGNAFHIDVQATDKVYLDGVTLDDGDKISNATPSLGDSISIVAFQTGASTYDWRAQTIQGTWVDGS